MSRDRQGMSAGYASGDAILPVGQLPNLLPVGFSQEDMFFGADACNQFFLSRKRRNTRYWRDWSSDVCSSDLSTLPVMSSPSNVIEPERARGLPQIVISRVDLPAPLAPIRVTISPLATSRSTPCSAWMAP